MGRRVVHIVAVSFVALAALATVYLIGIRSGDPAVRKAARRFHRAVGNPLQMRTAGMPGAYASVIRHRGRRTGRTYETPVWAARAEEGFVVAIVYGPHTDWLENVLASGTAVIVNQGHTYPVDRPEVVPMEGARVYFPAWTRRIHRRIRVDRCLRVRRAEAALTRPRRPSNREEVGERSEVTCSSRVKTKTK
jgi:deazaflavin-dependent oxidoreductase (nitroreductase family)